MNNFFLHNVALDTSDITEFENGIKELLSVSVEKNSDTDIFMRSPNLWDYQFKFGLLGELFGNEQLSPEFRTKILSIFFEREFIESDLDIQLEQDFDEFYPEDCNGFLGVDFIDLAVSLNRQITDEESFKRFKAFCLSKIDFRSFWDKRVEMFPNLILCGEVEAQISKIGNSSYFFQILERLKELDSYASNWKQGAFSYRDVNHTKNLRISPESEQTMHAYGNQRVFSLPELGRIKCELHIKTGNLRFHFYPDDKTFKIYIAYIGHHLDTISG
ncbi:MAG TPA: hypothetical protein DCQ31_18985 [Bacteroidales bacterium]|nr:hypothetical protein [Bacteroidales bacterium]